MVVWTALCPLTLSAIPRDSEAEVSCHQTNSIRAQKAMGQNTDENTPCPNMAIPAML